MYKVIRPVYRMGRMMVVTNVSLWKHQFWQAWEPLPLDQKLVWLFFINNTIAILTLVEFIFLKKH